MNVMEWHHAVHKGGFYMKAACEMDYVERKENGAVVRPQGITINRGMVTCSECLRMMGLHE